jgi:hypothetical protein
VKSAARQSFAPLRAAGTAMAVVLVVGATLAAVAPASAEQADRNKPISFSGDTGDANLQARGGALTGNVIITQGTVVDPRRSRHLQAERRQLAVGHRLRQSRCHPPEAATAVD